MSLNVNTIFSKKSIAFLGFFIIFPFFIFYHTLISFGIINPIFGSLLGSASFLIVLIFIISYLDLKRAKVSRINKYEFIVWTFYLYILFWATFNFVLHGHYYYIEASFNQVIASLGVSLSLYLIGKYIYIEKTKVLILVSFSVFLVFLFIYTVITGKFNFMPNRVGGAEEVVATYQSFSGLILVMGLIALVITGHRMGQLVVFLSSVIIIFYLGSRSELVAYVLGAIVYFIYFTSIKHKIYMYIFLIISMFLLFVISIDLSYLSDSRVLELADVDNSSSWNSRMDLNQVAIQQVLDSPFIGFFGGHTYYFGTTGSYAHNIISSWVSFGFIGFFLYFILMLTPVIYSLRLYFLRKTYSNRKKVVFILSFVFLFLVIFSKSVYWTMPSLLWGLVVNRNEVK